MSLTLTNESVTFNIQSPRVTYSTIADMLNETAATEGDCSTVIDEGQGGTFIYRLSNAAINNGGTIFNGWTREYSGAVNVKWFGAKLDGTDDTSVIANAEAYSLLTGISVKEYVKLIGTNQVLLSSFDLFTSKREKITIPTALITIPIDRDWYIHYDFGNNRYINLRRTGHSGAHLVAIVRSNGTVLTGIELVENRQIKDSAIGRTKAKMKGSQKVRVALIGDSLTQGAGTYGTGAGEQAWFRMALSTTYVAAGFNVDNAVNIKYDNYGVPSQTPHFGFVQLGEYVRSGSSIYPTAQLFHKMEMLSRYGDDNFAGGISKLREGNYDIAIIGYANRYGDDSLAYLAETIRQLRLEGIEVIIQTANSGATSDSLETDIEVLSRVADAYGCDIMDTWAFIDTLQESGVDPYADAIHMNEFGHAEWAKCTRSIFDYPETNNSSANAPTEIGAYNGTNSNVLYPIYGGREVRFPEAVDLQVVPYSTTGTTITTTAGAQGLDQFKNPAVQIGGRDENSFYTELTVGEVAKFAHTAVLACDLMCIQGSDWTAEIRDTSSGTVLKTLSQAGGSTYPNLTKVFELGSLTGQLDNNQHGMKQRSIEIVVTVGTMKLLGVAWYTNKFTQIPPEDLYLNGTWLQEKSHNGGIGAVGTDVIGDFMEWSGRAKCVMITVPLRNTTGDSEVYVNGKLYTTITYTSGTTYENIFIFPQKDSGDNIYKASNKMSIKVKLTSVIGTPAVGNRHLMISSFAIME